MKKHGWKFFLLLIALILIFLWLIKAPILSTYISKKMGIPVTMRTISVWPKTTTIRHFRIANPSRYRDPTALEVDKSVIQYEWSKLIARPSVIDLITLDDVELNIIIDNISGSDNNWSELGAMIPKQRGEREVLIKRLILNRLTVHISGPGAKVLGVSGTKRFDRMEFDNINSKDGFPTKELINQIFKGAGLLKYLEKFLNPTKAIEDTLNLFKIFGEIKNPRMAPRVDVESNKD